VTMDGGGRSSLEAATRGKNRGGQQPAAEGRSNGRTGGRAVEEAKTSTRRPAATGSAPADSRRPPDDRRRS